MVLHVISHQLQRARQLLVDFNYQKNRRQNFRLQFIKKCYVQGISYCEFKDWRTKSVDLDEVAHYEPPHQDLRCL